MNTHYVMLYKIIWPSITAFPLSLLQENAMQVNYGAYHNNQCDVNLKKWRVNFPNTNLVG